MSAHSEQDNHQAWVVFSGQADWPWLRFLKPGFRHCYVLINDGEHWVSVDPLLPHMEVLIHHVPPTFNLPDWLRGRGYKVVASSIERGHKKPAPFMLFTCVEAVKRVLGLHRLRIVTPWQLYRHLNMATA